MQYGSWELRDNDYTGYYFSNEAQIYPSSNATDEGKLNTEENIRNIYRDLIGRNYVLKYNYFSMSSNVNRNGVILSPGEAIIQGYHFYAKNSIEIKVPNNTIYAENGTYLSKQPITQYTLGISLSYDAANHVTGDVINKEGNVGENEVLSGVYVSWFDDCQLECNYKNILVLGRAWVQGGKIVQDGIIDDTTGRTIFHGFEPDPFKDHRYSADTIEVEIHGHKTTKYDTIRDNMTQIHQSLYTYDSSHFPIELNKNERTKMPSFTTDIQDLVNYIPDWYTSKYGDYMTGALRFNNLSIDKKQENDETVSKDSTDGSDGAFISPRTYGSLVVENNTTAYNNDCGGTFMTIVPGTYDDSTDHNDGYTGIHAALLSQKYGEVGLKLHYGNGEEKNKYNSTRLVHYNNTDSGITENVKNTANFIIENTDNTGRLSSIDFKNGEIFIDSYNSSVESPFNDNLKKSKFEGNHYGSGINLFVSGERNEQIKNNIDFRIDETYMSMANHEFINHRTGTRGTEMTGSKNDTLHYKLGLGINQNGEYCENTDPYLQLGNLRFRSNCIDNQLIKQNIIEVYNTGKNNDQPMLPYISIQPRVYSQEYLSNSLIQIGADSLIGNASQDNVKDKIVLKKTIDNNKDFTYLEQDYSYENNSKVFIKSIPSINTSINYNEIHGIYSNGNIGCSNKLLTPGSSTQIGENNPYSDDKEWVRFTRFRYDLDKDSINGGTNIGAHNVADGRKWGNTYNIEFNTNVANERANQIIWRYNGSKGVQSDTIDYTPPVILSYVHDNLNKIGEATKYTNIDGNRGDYEEWIDYAGNVQSNPTNKVRDFLLLENAGLVVSGDINNPSICGDSLNTPDHLGVTIVAGRVYNSVYNDFAETFEKDNKNEFVKPGTLIALNPETGKYTTCEGFENKMIVGIQSNSYAYLAGGNRINNAQDALDLENEYFTVAVSGKVWVNVVKNSYIKPGDILTSSIEKGKATKSKHHTVGTIIGKALSEPKYFEKDDEYKVLVLVMTA